MIESGSSIQTFMTCPRKYYYKYEKLLDPKGWSSALGFGAFFHAEVERHTGGRIDASEQELARFLAEKPTDLHEYIKGDKVLAEAVFLQWERRWSAEHAFDNSKFEWVNSENEWGFDVAEHIHVGKSDGVVRQKSDGTLFLYELKSAADRSTDVYIQRLEIDRQVSSNIMALQKQGIDIKGVLYDIYWKPAIRLKTGRKTMPDETPAEFQVRLIETIADDPNSCFERMIVYRSDAVLARHEQDLKGQYAAIELAKTTGNYFRNTEACMNWGRLCPFFSTCVDGNEGLEELYAVRSRKLPELSEEIQCKFTVPPT